MFSIFPCFLMLTYCSGSFIFPRGKAVQLCCWARMYENGGDRVLMRRPGASPPTILPCSAPLSHPVMNCERLCSLLRRLTHTHPIRLSKPLPHPRDRQRRAECLVFNCHMTCFVFTQITRRVCFLRRPPSLHSFKTKAGKHEFNRKFKRPEWLRSKVRV